MNSINDKKIIQTISLLAKEELSKEEILKQANIKSSTFHKYLNLCKDSGIEISVKSRRYRIADFQECLYLADFELSLLSHLLITTHLMLPKKKILAFKNAVDKMMHLTNTGSYEQVKEKFKFYRKIASSNYQKKITLLDDIINTEKSVKITTKRNKEIALRGMDIIWELEKPYLKYININDDSINKICLDDIVKIMDIDQQAFIPSSKDTIFEIYGNLSKSYLLKDEERVVDFGKDKLVIANMSHDKKTLFKRLLRYDILCKVVAPKSDVKEFKELINQSLSNLGKL